MNFIGIVFACEQSCSSCFCEIINLFSLLIYGEVSLFNNSAVMTGL